MNAQTVAVVLGFIALLTQNVKLFTIEQSGMK